MISCQTFSICFYGSVLAFNHSKALVRQQNVHNQFGILSKMFVIFKTSKVDFVSTKTTPYRWKNG
jgi:hypothetical protein